MASRPLIRESLRTLDICGINPKGFGTLSNIKFAALQMLSTYVGVEILSQCFYNWKGLNSMDALGFFISIYQLLFKFAVMLVNRKKLIKILNNMEQFWALNEHGRLLQTEFEAIYSATKKFAKYGIAVVVICIFMYFSKAALSTPRTLPFDTYHPINRNDSPDYELMYLLQLLMLSFGSIAALGFDGLFVSFIINIICEFKAIKQGFSEIPVNVEVAGDENQSLRKLKQLIGHHNLILGCIKDLNAVYCILLLNLFAVNMFCICAGLLCVIADGIPPRPEIFTKSFLFVMIYVWQLFFYCFVGSQLITESESVSNAVFETRWWAKTQPKLRKAYVLVIQRANRSEKLTAGGMFTLNLDSFTLVIKNALSFFTFMQAVYDTEEH